MIRCSVLMSIFNETESQICESVESILNQTFKDFEFIVICDNPTRTDLSGIMSSFMDERVKLLYNDKNYGLAMSMNRAAENATTDVYARMDADDIAMPDRLEKEYRTLVKENADLVFSGFVYIDERSAYIGNVHHYAENLNEHSLSREISLRPDLIHHPTVMMRRGIFEKLGGYRNFPCTQDVDLWMRMQEAGAKFFLINEPLLKYRVNPNGTTQRKAFKQYITGNYIYQLSFQRLKNGHDNFSKGNYEAFLKKNGLGSARSEKFFNLGFRYLRKSVKSSSWIIGTYYRFLAFLLSPQHRASYLNRKKKANLIAATLN